MESNGTNITTEGDSVPDKVVQSLVLTVGIASVIFNGTLFFVMTFNSRQVFASLGSYFIYNLAIADFVTGINSIVWALKKFMPPSSFSAQTNMALLTIFWITVQVSFFTIFIMSTERLVAIVFPFKAALLMSKKKTTIYCIAVWIFAIVCGGLINFKVDEVQLFLTIVFELVILCIVIEYIQVFRQLRVLWQNSKTRAIYNGHNNNHPSGKKQSKTTDLLQREYEVTIVVLTLVVILVITVFPYMITIQIVLCYKLFSTPLSENHPVYMFSWYYFPVELLNFVVDPIVYGWRLPKYRKAFLATFRSAKNKKLNCNSNESPRTLRTNCPENRLLQ